MEKVPKLQQMMKDPLPRSNYKARPQVLAPVFREPDPPKAFKFQAGNGLWLNVRPEKRGHNIYWFVNKQHDGKRHRLYIAPAGLLTRSLLENAAARIAAACIRYAYGR
jgi:hypothetical protein